MPNDHYGKRILRMWESNWGDVSKRRAERFLSHRCLPQIKQYHEMHVRAALSKHRRLEDVLAELERTVNYAERSGHISSQGPDGKQILRMWESNWGQLSKQQQAKFLSHNCLPRIRRYQEIRIRHALSKYQKLEEVLEELERPINLPELAEFIRSLGPDRKPS